MVGEPAGPALPELPDRLTQASPEIADAELSAGVGPERAAAEVEETVRTATSAVAHVHLSPGTLPAETQA